MAQELIDKEYAKSLIASWVNFSILFSEAFPVERHQGLQWFFVEILLLEFGKNLSIGEYKEIASDLKLIDNANYYVPVLLADLQHFELVELLSGGKRKKHPATAAKDNEIVHLTDKFSTAVVNYVAGVLRKFLNNNSHVLTEIQARSMMSKI